MTEWPGKQLGIRAPERDETLLSRGEVDHLLAHWAEIVRIFWRPIGDDK
jgi:hypothetical protein